MPRLSDILDEGVLRDCEVSSSGFADAAQTSVLTFAASRKYLAQAAANPSVAAIVTTEALAPDWPAEKGLVVAPDVERAFYGAHNALAEMLSETPLVERAIDGTARVADSALIGLNVAIGPGAEICEGAIILEDVSIGEGAYVGAGAMIGVEGHFGKYFDGELVRVRHTGGVAIGARSHVHAGAIVQKPVERAFTVIGEDSVVGPGAQVGHGVKIGRETVVTGGVVLAGYSKIGERVWVGPGAVIRNLTSVGDGARVEIGAVVATSAPEGARLSSPFAMAHTKVLRLMAKWMRE